jgi:hypothetical protein
VLPISTRLIGALVAVGNKSPLTAHCLCRLALSLKGAQAVLAIPKWMEEGCLSLIEGVTLLLVICRFTDTRDALMEVSGFPAFLLRIVTNGETKEMEAIVVVLRKMNVNADFVRVLDDTGFFAVFFPKAIDSRVPVLQDGALLIVAAFARVVWVNGFVYLMQYFPGMINRGGVLGRKVMHVILLLSIHPEAKGLLIYLKVSQAIAACEVDPTFRTYKETLLIYLRS